MLLETEGGAPFDNSLPRDYDQGEDVDIHIIPEEKYICRCGKRRLSRRSFLRVVFATSVIVFTAIITKEAIDQGGSVWNISLNILKWGAGALVIKMKP